MVMAGVVMVKTSLLMVIARIWLASVVMSSVWRASGVASGWPVWFGMGRDRI